MINGQWTFDFQTLFTPRTRTLADLVVVRVAFAGDAVFLFVVKFFGQPLVIQEFSHSAVDAASAAQCRLVLPRFTDFALTESIAVRCPKLSGNAFMLSLVG